MKQLAGAAADSTGASAGSPMGVGAGRLSSFELRLAVENSAFFNLFSVEYIHLFEVVTYLYTVC